MRTPITVFGISASIVIFVVFLSGCSQQLQTRKLPDVSPEVVAQSVQQFCAYYVANSNSMQSNEFGVKDAVVNAMKDSCVESFDKYGATNGVQAEYNLVSEATTKCDSKTGLKWVHCVYPVVQPKGINVPSEVK